MVEIGSICAMYRCNNYRGPCASEIFYRFPKNKEMRPHICEECEQDVALCENWTEHLVALGTSFIPAMFGCFFLLYYYYFYERCRGEYSRPQECYWPGREYLAQHAICNTVALLIFLHLGVMVFKMCCFCYPNSRIFIHAALTLLTVGIFSYSINYGRNGTELQKHRPQRDSAHVAYLRPHIVAAGCTLFLLIVQCLMGTILVFVRRPWLLNTHKALGVATYAVAFLLLTNVIQQEQNRIPRKGSTYEPWSRTHFLHGFGACLGSVSMLVTCAVLLRPEINANNIIVVPDVFF